MILEQFSHPEVTFGNVTFKVSKMLPMEAHNIFMGHVRPLLRGALSANVTSGEADWQMMLAAFTDAPVEHYYSIQDAMWRHVTYKRSDTQEAHAMLLGDHENAFRDLEGAHMIMLNARAFTVNFIGWWDVVRSEFPALAQATHQFTPSTSSPSSQP